MILYRNLIAASCVIFTTGIAPIHLVNMTIMTDKSKSSWCPGQDAHNVDSPNCKRPGEINRPKRICMFCRLLLEELAVLAFHDDLHRAILGCRLVKTMPKDFAYDKAS
jgi:hypothetical protein